MQLSHHLYTTIILKTGKHMINGRWEFGERAPEAREQSCIGKQWKTLTM